MRTVCRFAGFLWELWKRDFKGKIAEGLPPFDKVNERVNKMALITEGKIDKIEKTRNFVHQETTCTYSVFTAESGEKYFQLDTYGSADRKILDKVSQSIQFQLGSAKKLVQLLKREFSIT